MSEPDKCYLCLRITRENREEIVRKVFVSKYAIQNIMTDMDMIIPYAYNKSPTDICHNKFTMIGGLLHVLSIRHHCDVRARDIAEFLSVSVVSVRRNSKLWLELFPELFEDVLKLIQERKDGTSRLKMRKALEKKHREEQLENLKPYILTPVSSISRSIVAKDFSITITTPMFKHILRGHGKRVIINGDEHV